MLADPATNSVSVPPPVSSPFPPPLFTYVCPPQRVLLTWFPAIPCLAAVAALFAYLVAIRHPWPKTLGLTGVLTALVAVIFGVINLFRHHSQNVARQTFLRRHP